MTLEEANEIIDRVSKMWPFSRLNDEELREVEKAYKLVRAYQLRHLNDDTPEAPF